MNKYDKKHVVNTDVINVNIIDNNGVIYACIGDIISLLNCLNDNLTTADQILYELGYFLNKCIVKE